MAAPRRSTRPVRVGNVTIGGGAPIAVQSMAATRTQDIEATVRQVNLLHEAGADIVRIAVDSRKDVEALAEVRRRTSATLSVDLQENYRLAEIVAPHVDKIRYNPGHLHHHEKDKPVREKVRAHRRDRDAARPRAARRRELRLGGPGEEGRVRRRRRRGDGRERPRALRACSTTSASLATSSR